MSQSAFQSSLVRLIVDPDFREAVRTQPGFTLPSDLTPRDRRRLSVIADLPGLDINRLLHKGFRLGKLRALAPLTCTLLGSRRLAETVAAFWREHPPRSFSFLIEALAFCRFLRRLINGRRVAYLREVIAYEEAVLTLEEAGGKTAEVRVPFRYDPGALLGALAAGKRPRNIPRRKCVLVGSRTNQAPVWRVEEESSQGVGT
jgi:hypothetical protein